MGPQMTPKQLEIAAMVYGFAELTEDERDQVRRLRAARKATAVRRESRVREGVRKRRAS